ncbi:hypothetical protein [Paenibacillus paeoniae]|uniref:hypothetical protein n=1 Tax=Paenibacillus paeoniae TaxID=2292705 RepID=UPI0010590790|nr:hypothetical protein [Paenibacillus paeoniae]
MLSLLTAARNSFEGTISPTGENMLTALTNAINLIDPVKQNEEFGAEQWLLLRIKPGRRRFICQPNKAVQSHRDPDSLVST